VTSFENLWLAFPRDRPGKRGRADVAAFEFDLERNLLAIADPTVSAVTPGRKGGKHVGQT